MINKLVLLVGAIIVFVTGIFLGTKLDKKVTKSGDATTTVYAIYDGKKILASDVNEAIKSDLEQFEKNIYQLKRKATEDLIKKQIANANPKEAQLSKLSNIEIDQKEFTKYLAERNIDLKKLSAKQLSDVRANYKIQKNIEINKMKPANEIESSKIVWKIPLPAEEFVKADNGPFPVNGNAKTTTKIVYFGNYHCPNCHEAEKRLSELKDKYKDQIQVFYRFVLIEPDNSLVRAAAEASYCANDQEKFWPYRDYLMKLDKFDDPEILKSAAQAVGLETEKFNKCLKDRTHKEDLEKEVQTNLHLVKEMIPAFIINGRLRSASLSADELAVAIEQDQSRLN